MIVDDIAKYIKQGREYAEAMIAIGATLTEDQDQFNRECDLIEMYLEWKKSLPQLEEAQWLNIFPNAPKKYERLIKGKLKIERKYLLRKPEAIKQEAARRTALNPSFVSFYKEWRDEEIRKVQKRINTIGHLFQLIKRSGSTGKQTDISDKKIEITPEMIERAKAYPLDQLVEIKRGFTRCFGHDDQKPSAYCKGNFIHCFVCQKQWDTIAVLMERDGLTFRQAVLQLQS